MKKSTPPRSAPRHARHDNAGAKRPAISNLRHDQTQPHPAASQPATPLTEGSLADQSLLLRAAMVRAIKHCRLSRWDIAAKISEITGKELTKPMLDKYCSESASTYRLPADQLAAFCLVTEDCGPLEVIAQPCGRLVLPRLAVGMLAETTCEQLMQDLTAIMEEAGEAAAEARRTLQDHKVSAGERVRCVREFLDVAQRALEACAHLQRGATA